LQRKKNARKGTEIYNRVNLQGNEFAGGGTCKECLSCSLVIDYFVSISSVGGSIWPTIPVYIM